MAQSRTMVVKHLPKLLVEHGKRYKVKVINERIDIKEMMEEKFKATSWVIL